MAPVGTSIHPLLKLRGMMKSKTDELMGATSEHSRIRRQRYVRRGYRLLIFLFLFYFIIPAFPAEGNEWNSCLIFKFTNGTMGFSGFTGGGCLFAASSVGLLVRTFPSHLLLFHLFIVSRLSSHPPRKPSLLIFHTRRNPQRSD